MKRLIFDHLQTWLQAEPRKPLILRGARQVGKTWLVRHLAQTENKQLVEINFEKQSEAASLFSSNDPKQILLNIAAAYGAIIHPNTALLFLDEIQAVPELLSKLRWFAEEMPELPVIAAGSLLEFVLAEHNFSMPVGRITYAHIEPLSFEEFLWACDKESLYQLLVNQDISQSLPLLLHEQLTELFKEYLYVGGMPAVVASWVKNKNLIQVQQLQQDLLATYKDDFTKYAKKSQWLRLTEILQAVPRLLGQKFKYTHVNKEVSALSLKESLELLVRARLCHKVQACHANGLPLAAESNHKFFKMIFIDVGLACAALGLGLHQLKIVSEINLINQGGVSEQIVGQLLRTLQPFYIEPALYYWLREEKGAAAEVDYIMQHHDKIIPLEVKSGSTGTLKSLHVFMKLKSLDVAVRVNSELAQVSEVSSKIYDGSTVKYKLLSIPFYSLGQVHRWLEKLMHQP